MAKSRYRYKCSVLLLYCVSQFKLLAYLWVLYNRRGNGYPDIHIYPDIQIYPDTERPDNKWHS